jgi:RibD C-terminal domain
VGVGLVGDGADAGRVALAFGGDQMVDERLVPEPAEGDLVTGGERVRGGERDPAGLGEQHLDPHVVLAGERQEIMAHGGAAFVQALSRHGLIVEYRLVILPVALGGGKPLFKDLARPLRVNLAEARSFADGTVIHVYQPVTPAG